jgi:hypothetical protein
VLLTLMMIGLLTLIVTLYDRFRGLRIASLSIRCPVPV